MQNDTIFIALSDNQRPLRLLTSMSVGPSVLRPVFELSLIWPATALACRSRLRSNRRFRLAVPLSEEKLISVLGEIQSDIRQIKSDLQALLALLKQQQNAAPVSSSDGDPVAEPAESGRSASPEDVLRYLRETRGEDDTGD